MLETLERDFRGDEPLLARSELSRADRRSAFTPKNAFAGNSGVPASAQCAPRGAVCAVWDPRTCRRNDAFRLGERRVSALRRWIGRGIENDADRKSTRLNSSHVSISYAVFCFPPPHHLHSFPTRRSSDLRLPQKTPLPAIRACLQARSAPLAAQFALFGIRGHAGETMRFTSVSAGFRPYDAGSEGASRTMQIGRAHV